ncbi:hypothetical protein PTKIN_Ptkin19aG0128700 [Pterospermum kingtungense]
MVMALALRSVVLIELIITILVTFAWAVKATSTVDAAAVAKSGCKSQCGGVTIRYPFGIGDDCSINSDFSITCNASFNPPKPFLNDVEVLSISLNGRLRILMGVQYECYDNTTVETGDAYLWPLALSTFPINNARNKLTAIGCNIDATLLLGTETETFSTGCETFCRISQRVIDGSCSGIGCCERGFPKGVVLYFDDIVIFRRNISHVLHEDVCSYAFVAENGNYTFSRRDLRGYDFRDRKFAATLDWTIGSINCRKANSTNFACMGNTTCVDSANGGYLCKCLHGYEGNPYLNGCQDINECETIKPCVGTCQNLPGGYNCLCPKGYEGDGRKKGTGCKRKMSPIIEAALGTSCGFLLLLLVLLLLYKQRQISKLREKYFEQNGGNLLRELLSKRQGYSENVRIFAAKELQKATDNYHESRILGKGGQGTVYKGVLADNRMVAVKRARIGGDQSQVEAFINEILVLCRVNHRNVVKLLGCCLETPVPLLVYEYVTNGTLFDHLHNNGTTSSILPWEIRLKIARETAQVLSYLHSAAFPPIIHRDIKLANILLDQNYNAKVSDFGTSRMNPSDKAQITTLVQGTLGYLDPEYFQTSQLTEKSDVYSFGVVLIELLTGRKALCFKRPEEEWNLANYFISMMEKDRLLEILDLQVIDENTIEQLEEVAALAMRCVSLRGEERPTMREVTSELEGLQAMKKHPIPRDLLEEETDDLYNISSDYESLTSMSMEWTSIKKQVRFEIEAETLSPFTS